jgi:hypothetical protein
VAKAPINVSIAGDYNDKDINRAIKDLNSLKTQGDGTTTAMGGLQRGMRSLMPSMAMIGLAAGAAAVAAAGMAVKFGVDSVQAFIEDEAAATKLATTMNNLGFSKATPEVEAMIDAQQRLTGIADTELRPAFDRLIRATRDVGQASQLLVLAQNVAVGTGNELSAVTAALSKAAVGSTTALGKLGTGITATELKANSFEQNIQRLNEIFNNQAQTAAQTYQGQVARLGVAFGELQESFGRGFVQQLGDTTDKTNELMAAMKNAEPGVQQLGATAADATIGVVDLAGSLGRADSATQAFGRRITSGFTLNLIALGNAFGFVSDKEFAAAEADRDYYLQTGKTSRAVAGNLNPLQLQIRALDRLKGEYVTASGAAVGFAGAQDLVEFEVSEASAAILKQFAAINNLQQDMQDAGTRAIALAGADDTLRLESDRAAAALAALGSSAGGAAQASDTLTKAQERVAQKIADLRTRTDAAIQTFNDYRDSVAESFNGLLDLGAAFDSFTERQTNLAKAQKELTDFQTTIVGEATDSQVKDLAKLQAAYHDASESAAKGSQSVVEEFEAQGRKLAEFGENLSRLVAAGLGRRAFDAIRGMTAERGAELSASLVGGMIEENVDRINSVYDSINTMAIGVGNQGAIAFERVGLTIASTMIETMLTVINGRGRARLQRMLDDLNSAMNVAASGAPMPAASTYNAGLAAFQGGPAAGTAAGDAALAAFLATPGAGLNFAPGNIFGFANGGPVQGGRTILVGEAGPELFTPSRSGSIIPNGAMGGNTYNINVSAGVGDPRAIGQQIVEYVKRFEKANGPVFAAA